MESLAATQRLMDSIVQEEVPALDLGILMHKPQLRSPLQWFLCGAVPRVVARGPQPGGGDWEPDTLAQWVGTSGPPRVSTAVLHPYTEPQPMDRDSRIPDRPEIH